MKKQSMTYVMKIGLFVVVLLVVYYGSYQLSVEYFQKNISLENQIEEGKDFASE